MIPVIYPIPQQSEGGPVMTSVKAPFGRRTVNAMNENTELGKSPSMITFSVQYLPSEFGFIGNPSDYTTLASEEAFAKIWDDPAEDEAWRDL